MCNTGGGRSTGAGEVRVIARAQTAIQHPTWHPPGQTVRGRAPPPPPASLLQTPPPPRWRHRSFQLQRWRHRSSQLQRWWHRSSQLQGCPPQWGTAEQSGAAPEHATAAKRTAAKPHRGTAAIPLANPHRGTAAKPLLAEPGAQCVAVAWSSGCLVGRPKHPGIGHREWRPARVSAEGRAPGQEYASFRPSRTLFSYCR